MGVEVSCGSKALEMRDVQGYPPAKILNFFKPQVIQNLKAQLLTTTSGTKQEPDYTTGGGISQDWCVSSITAQKNMRHLAKFI